LSRIEVRRFGAVPKGKKMTMMKQTCSNMEILKVMIDSSITQKEVLLADLKVYLDLVMLGKDLRLIVLDLMRPTYLSLRLQKLKENNLRMMMIISS